MVYLPHRSAGSGKKLAAAAFSRSSVGKGREVLTAQRDGRNIVGGGINISPQGKALGRDMVSTAARAKLSKAVLI